MNEIPAPTTLPHNSLFVGYVLDTSGLIVTLCALNDLGTLTCLLWCHCDLPAEPLILLLNLPGASLSRGIGSNYSP